MCVKKSECVAFLRKILISEKNVLTLSRCLKPTNVEELFDTLDMGPLHSEHNKKFIAFNPCFEGLRSLVKKQDAAFNWLLHNSSFTQKRLIHRKNVQIWIQQTLELSMELLGMMTSIDVSASGEIGCPNFFAYLKLQGASKWSGRNILTSIFFNKKSDNDHLLIVNFQNWNVLHFYV
jgi:hypothetical protein